MSDAPEEEYFDLAVQRQDMPYPSVEFDELLEYGLVSFSDSDALRDICGRIVRVFQDGDSLRVRFLRLGNSFRTRSMRSAALQPSLGHSYYQQYIGVLHGHVDVHRKICHPTRVVIVCGTVHELPAGLIRLVKLDDP